MQVITKVQLFRSPFTICCLTEKQCTLPSESHYKNIGVRVGDRCEINITEEKPANRRLKFTGTAYFLQPFVKECMNSYVYRTNVVTHLNQLSGNPESGTVFLKLILEPPDLEIIDYAWNDRVQRLVWTRVEIENAFSWLSTLGGAYSALGDYFEDCAEEAGRIAVRQYKLSKMLGDDGLAARSRLYSALSLSQKGRLHTSRHIVRNIAKFACETKDKRLIRMCQGVWAKLKYLRSLKHAKNRDCDIGNGKVITKSV